MSARLYAPGETCSIPGCKKPVKTRGWCNAHYLRWWSHGTTDDTRRPLGLTEAEVFAWFMPGNPPLAPSPTEGCWDWTGYITLAGYGHFRITADNEKIHILAHRTAYQIFVGPIPEDRPFILHSCDRPICVQPAHLTPGTQQDNMAQKVARGRGAVGERVGSAKLTEQEVQMIRQSSLTYRAIAEQFGVSRDLVGKIRRGQLWRHVF